MCLVALAVRPHPALALVVAGNRDEYHERPSRPLAPWDDRPDVLAGRDLRAGGTWLGVTRSGRFAAVTNVRSPAARREGRSRGELVRGFLENGASAVDYCAELAQRADAYPAFNLLVSDGTETRYTHEALGEGRTLEPGIHGISNARMDDPWPKVTDLCATLAAAIGAEGALDAERLFAALRSEARAPDASLPSTGVPLELERALSAAFIVSPVYGTRCSTVAMLGADGTGFIEERRFDASGAETGRSRLLLAG